MERWQLEAIGEAGEPLLPPGRWPMTAAELHRIAVADFPASRSRPALWSRFLALQTELGDTAVEFWVGGSMLSTKLDPKDVDVCAVLRSDRVRVPSGRRREDFLTDLAYEIGERVGVDLKLIFDDERDTAGARWEAWMAGKPWLRSPARGLAVIR